MPQASTNVTFKNNSLPNTGGVDSPNGQTVAVEYLAADPTDLATTSPRIWVNTTTGILKFTYNTAGTPVKSVTAT
jgi:hypothetical protein